MGRKRSSNCDFTFYIDRWLHPSSNNLLSLQEMQALNIAENEAEHHVITLNVTGWACCVEGNTSALPENSYPDEFDSEITSVTDENENDWLDRLTKFEINQIEDKLYDEMEYQSSSYDDSNYEDDYYDRYNSKYHPYDDQDYNY